jgi:hypothetical protein
MLRLLKLLFILAVRSFRSRRDLLLENLALRQQLAVWKRRRPQPRLFAADKLFWVILRRFWPGWKRALILIKPLVRRKQAESSDTSCEVVSMPRLGGLHHRHDLAA